jgi:type IV pilus assembly protein PilB
MQCSINEKIGLTFEETLRAVVRQDPDVIVLGEMRDRTSAEIAIQAALTGHQVFTTFHTEDSVGALLRLITMEIEPFLIASTVLSVLGQRLVRRICDHCREEYRPGGHQLALLEADSEELSKYLLSRGRGCEQCHYTGYHGRVPICELLIPEEGVRQAVLDRQPIPVLRRACLEQKNLVTMQEAGIAAVVNGETTVDEVLARLPKAAPPRAVSTILELLNNQSEGGER